VEFGCHKNIQENLLFTTNSALEMAWKSSQNGRVAITLEERQGAEEERQILQNKAPVQHIMNPKDTWDPGTCCIMSLLTKTTAPHLLT